MPWAALAPLVALACAARGVLAEPPRPALPEPASARALELGGWEFMPLEMQPGQVGVKCGSGTFVKWLSGTGSYVLQGDPVIELCPPEADRSVTCLAGASGYLVAEQAIGPGDDINETVPDGHLAIIEERVVKQDDGRPVKCAPGTVFESFLVSLGDVIQPGDAVALTLPTAGGGLTHCRTEVGGRVVALKNDLQEGQDVASVCPDLVVAYIGETYEGGQRQEPASGRLRRPARDGDESIEVSFDGETEFSVSNEIRISSGSLSETATVVGVGPITTLDRGLRNSYPAGATVTKLQDTGDGGGASGPPEGWRPRSSLFHDEGAGFQQNDNTRNLVAPGAARGPAGAAAAELGAAAAVLATQRRLWVGYGPGSQECTSTPTPVTTSPTPTPTTTSPTPTPTTTSPTPTPVTTRSAPVTIPTMSATASSTTTTVASATITTETVTETTTSTTGDHVVEISFDANFSEVLATDHDKEMLKQLLHKTYQPHGCKQVLDLRPGSIIARLKMGRNVDPDVLKGVGCVELEHKNGRICPHGVQSHASPASPNFLNKLGVPGGGRGGLIGIVWMLAALLILGLLGLFAFACRGKLGKDPIYKLLPSDAVDTGVLVEFHDSIGRVQRKIFNCRPHGMVLSRSGTVKVEGFVKPNSYAKGLGIQERWSISRIGDHPVAKGSKFSDVDHRLRTALQDLSPNPLRIDFKTSKGSTERIDFERSPLGLEVSYKAPFKVEHITLDGQAHDNGVQEGWEVTQIGDEVITQKTESSQVHEWLETGEQHLPPEDFEKAVRLDVVDAHDHPHVVHLDRHGHGMKLERQDAHGAVQVKSFTCCSYASRKSMQTGMKILKIDGQELSSTSHGGKDPQAIEDLIHSKTEKFVPLPLKVVFDTGDAEGSRPHVRAGLGKRHQTVLFDRQPLGIDWSTTAPFKVTGLHIDSYAAEKGVNKGWSVVKIGSKDMTNVTDLEFEAALDEGTDHLPQVDKGLAVEFSDKGRRRIVRFNRVPFGMEFSEHAPTSVVDFHRNSYAKERGVRRDWQIVRIHTDGDLQHKSPAHVRQLLEKHAKAWNLEVWPLRVEFKTGPTPLDTRTFDFDKRPLGIMLSNGPAFKVDHFKPDSYAEAQDVKLGWEVTKIGQQRVGATQSFLCFPQRALAEGSEHLQEMPGMHMIVEFDTGNHKRQTFWLRRRPLGFTVDDNFKVQKLIQGSYASDLGISPEWHVTRVGNEQVKHGTTGHQINEWLHRQSAELLPWPLRIVFDSSHSSGQNDLRTMYFERADLGILWSEHVPMRVESFEPNSYAQDKGVRNNWVVVEVGDKNVSRMRRVSDIKVLLEEGQMHLDHEGSGLRVEFVDGHRNLHSKTFEYMPSGITWDLHNVPAKVEDFTFNSYAESLGVQIGWTVKKLARTDMSHKSGGQVERDWAEKESANGLKQWPLRITFRTDASSPRKGHETTRETTKTVSFPCRPLGIVFEDRVPIKIAKVEALHDDGASHEVDKGWVITHIADKDVTKMKKEEVHKLLEKGLRPLHKVAYKRQPGSPAIRKSDSTVSSATATSSPANARGDPCIQKYPGGGCSPFSRAQLLHC